MKGFLTNLPKVETERLILRKFKLIDSNDMYEYSSNSNVSKYVTWSRHENIEMSEEFLRLVLNNYIKGELPAPWAVVNKENNKVIGAVEFVIIDNINKYAEIGYVLSEDYWGQGLIVEACKELLSIGFDSLNLNRIQARCMTENIQSSRVMEKLNMTFEGILRKYNYVKGSFRDIKIYSILKDEWVNI